MKRFVQWLALGAAWALLAGEAPKAPAPGPRGEKRPAPKPRPANNRRCLGCHSEFEKDVLSVRHGEAGIGCVKCHGRSQEHAADDSNRTAPDIIIWRDALNDHCLECHPKEKLTDDHGPFLAGKTPKKYCTQCHTGHRLEFRTRLWDPVHRVLLPKEMRDQANAERQAEQTPDPAKPAKPGN